MTAWQADGTKNDDDIAVLIFEALYKKQVSKAMVAEQLAALIDALPDTPAAFKVKLPAYIVNAIEHVTISEEVHVPEEQAPAAEAPAQ